MHQHQHGGLLHGLHHVLKLALLRVGFLQLGGDFGDGCEDGRSHPNRVPE